MNKVWMIFLFAVLGALILGGVIAAACFLVVNHMKGQVLDGPGMVNKTVTSVSYDCSGGMDGGSLSMTLELNPEGDCTFSYSSRESWNSKEETRSYKVSREPLYRLEDIFKSCRVESWGELKRSEIEALDAPTKSIVFVYDGKSYRLSDGYEFPEEGRGIIGDVYDILNECKEHQYTI